MYFCRDCQRLGKEVCEWQRARMSRRQHGITSMEKPSVLMWLMIYHTATGYKTRSKERYLMSPSTCEVTQPMKEMRFWLPVLYLIINITLQWKHMYNYKISQCIMNINHFMECLFSRTDLYKLNWYTWNGILSLNPIIKLEMYFIVHILGPIHNKITKAANLLKANS